MKHDVRCASEEVGGRKLCAAIRAYFAVGLVVSLGVLSSVCVFAVDVDTTTALSFSPTSAVVGQDVTVTWTITADTGDPVTFGDDLTRRIKSPLSETWDILDDTVTASGTTNPFESTSVFAPSTVGVYSADGDYEGCATCDPVLLASSGAAQLIVAKADTTVAIDSAAADPSVVGEPYTVSGMVTVVSPGGGTPTGTVTVDDGEEHTCAANVESDGSWGPCTLPSTSAGAKTLTATYEGDENFNGDTSDTVSHTVYPADTTLQITAHVPETSVVGEAFEVFWSLTVDAPESGTPTGNVTVEANKTPVDGTPEASCTASAENGSCTLTLDASDGPGTYQLTADYAGDADFNSSASGAANHVVEKAETSVAITGDSSNPSVVGQVYTVSGTVTAIPPGSGTPTGNVTVSDGESTCTEALSSGLWSCALTSTTAGPKTLTVSYAGDPNFNAAATTVGHDVDKANSVVTIGIVVPASSRTGQEYTVNGSVTGPVTATGTVIVTDGAGASCAANVESGAWSCKLSSLGPQGSKTLSAVYEGNENLNGSTDTESHTVNERPVSLDIVGPSQACVGETVTLTAQLSDATDPAVAGSPSFAGTVTWTLPGGGAATCTVAGSDSCSVTYTPVAGDVGDKTISAQYTGDPNYEDSAPIAHSLSITPRAVLIDITCQPATVYINQQTNITVTVTDVGCGASGTPTGTLSLTLVPQGGQAGTFVQPTGSSTSTGTLTFTGGKYTPTRNHSADDESHILKATFVGDGDFAGIEATGTFPLDVNKREVKVQVTASVSAAFIGEVVTVDVTVQDDTPGTSPCCLVFSGFPVDISLDDLGSAGGFDESLAGTFSEGSYGYTYDGPDGWPESGSITPGSLAFDLYYKAAAGGAGTTTLQATYPGNDLYKSASGSTTLTVETRPTTTSVTCAPAAVVVDQRTQILITVADVGPAESFSPPSGVLYLSTTGDGAFYETIGATTPITSKTVNPGTTIVYYEAETAAAAIDTHILKADYVGTGLPADAATQIHEDSSGTNALTVNLRKTTTTIEVDPETLPYRSDPAVMSSDITVTVLDVSSGDKSSPGGELMLEAPGGGGYFTLASCSPWYSAITGNGTGLLTLTWNSFDSALNGITMTATYTLIEKTVPVHPIVAVLVPDDGKHLASAAGTQVNVEVDEESYADTTPGTAPSASEGVISCGLIGGTAAAEIFNFTNGLQAYLDILWAADLGATILQVIPDVLVDVTDPAWSIIHAIFQGGTVDLDGDGIPGLFELGYVWAGLYDFNPDEDGDGIWTKDEIALAGGHFYPTILDTSYSWSRPNPTHPDSDRDGISDGDEYYTFLTNCCDPDSDDDGLTDGLEVGSWATFTVPTYDGAPASVTPSTDIRMHTDPWVQDTDGDGIRDDVEYYMSGSCPYPNDPDSDNDGLLDGYEDKNQDGCWGTHTGDTLPWTCNCDTSCDITIGTSTTQASRTISWWETDLCSPDTDGDGLLDGEEEGLFGAGEVTPKGVSLTVGTQGLSLGVTVPSLDSDMDNDGLSDYDEVNTYQTDPMDADTDDDTISDGDEVATWDYADARDHANPRMADTDGDGLTDNLEALDIAAIVRLDSDIPVVEGCPYVNDADSDDDGLQDGYEDGNHDGWYGYAEFPATWGHNIVLGDSNSRATYYGPLSRWETDPCDADSDDDGLTDGEEIGLFGAGWVTPLDVPTAAGDTIAALDDDCDNDGLSDYEEVNVTGTDPLDADTDNDGLLDSWELIVTGGAFPHRTFYQESDPLDPDTDDDGIRDDAEYNDGDGSGVGRASTPASEPGDPDVTCPYVNDDDSDDDGLQDGVEDWDHDGAKDFPATLGQTGTQADLAWETDPCDEDTDDDGLSDGEECALLGGLRDQPTVWHDSDPYVTPYEYVTAVIDTAGTTVQTIPALDDDCDDDGLSDYEEVNVTGTDPLDADTDDDGLLDAWELIVTAGEFPFRSFYQESDPLDPDTDDDGIRDDVEYNDYLGSGVGRDHGDPGPYGARDADCPYVNDDDSDDDGLQDGTEDANHDGTWGVLRVHAAPGSILLGSQAATNSDGYYETDLCNPDTDGDGLLDGEEVLLIGGGPIMPAGGFDPQNRPTRPVPGFDPVDPEGRSTALPVGPDYTGGPNPKPLYTFIPQPGPSIAATIPALDVDSDNDGLSDYEEVNITGTDPLDADSDNDTIMDGDELIAISDTWNDPEHPRRTFDQESDPLDINTDDDYLFDPVEGACADPIYLGTGLSALAGKVGGNRDADCPFVNNADSDDDGLQDGAVSYVDPGTSIVFDYSYTHFEAFADVDDYVGTGADSPGFAKVTVAPPTDGEQYSDGVCNVCDADSDGDGLADGEEVWIGTNPDDWDTDDDGRSDWHEHTGGGPIPTDPFDPDTDDDGLTDSVEVFGSNPTNPLNADTDGDGLCDGGTGTPWMLSTDARIMINPICKSCNDPASDVGLDPCVSGARTGSVDGIGDHPNPHGYGEDKDGDGAWDPGGYDYWGDVYAGDETDPNQFDTDGDADGDGIEVLGFSTSRQGWIPVLDLFDRPITVTYPACGCMNPLDPDTDDDQLEDGYEDRNHDGNFDFLPSEFDHYDPLPGPPIPYPTETNPCDADTDGDELTDYEERYQAQVFEFYVNWDNDGDGLYNEDPFVDGIDEDGDGLDGEDPVEPPFNPTNPLDHDTDNDWILDGPEVFWECVELAYWTLDNDTDGYIDEDPIDGEDNDGDGLLDEDPVDYWIRFVPMLDPTNRDSDSDGFIDGLDDDPCNSELIPLLAPVQAEPVDTDGDGFSDDDEVLAGTHPNDPEDHPAAFGMMNLDLDDCFDDRLWLEPTMCCGIANSVVIDIDSNILADIRVQIVRSRDARVGDFDGDGHDDDARYVIEYAFALYRVVQRRIVATIDDFDMDLVIDAVSLNPK